MNGQQAAAGLGELSCEQCRDLLSDYVDHELTAQEKSAVEHHLTTCRRCANESTCVTGLKRLMGQWDGIRGSGRFRDSVIQRMIRESQMLPARQFTEAAGQARALQAAQAPPAVWRRMWFWLALAAALVAAAVVIRLMG
jgi:anti-sigma factor RsiW